MAALFDEPQLAPLLAVIQGCQNPAYTYVLKLPLDPLDEWESALQWGLVSHNERALDDLRPWVNAPDQSDPDAQRVHLAEHGEDQYYGYQLARSAHTAAMKMFQIKQATAEPSCTIYAQSEIGENGLHVHLVLAGPGLNKYNAKSATKLLQLYWLSDLSIALHLRTSNGVPPEREKTLQFRAKIADMLSQSRMREDSQWCSILQYKSRNGVMHASRVNGSEFITNYLLPKNHKPCHMANPERATLFSCYWYGIRKTYQSTLVNGEIIPVGLRKKLWLALHGTQTLMNTEPAFSGQLFGNLPEVKQTEWKTGTGPLGGPSKPTKREVLMMDCMKRCEEKNLLTYEELVNQHAELVVMIESQPGGSKLIEQVLQMLHIKLVNSYSPLQYCQRLNSIARVEPGNKVFRLLNQQGYNPWQVGHWVCTLFNKRAGKQNTICFYGPASTGKTNLAKGLVNAVKLYGCVNHQNKNFIFNDCAHKLVVWWEECLMHNDWVEQAKCILGGTEFRIDRKHRESQLLPTTPVIISTNNDIYQVTGGNTVSHVHSKPLRERVVQLNFMNQLDPTFGEIDTEEIYAWLNSCNERFNPSLQSFLSTWELDKLPNTFPLQSLCSGCSQDFILHENGGICSHCGAYPELEVQDIGEPLQVSTPKRKSESPEWEFPEIGLQDLSWSGSDFSFSHLETPKKRRRQETAEEAQASTSTASPAQQPRLEPSGQDAESTGENRQEAQQEPEPGPSRPGLTPSQWGELLGVYTQALEDEPIVLHCFENLDPEEADTA